MSVGVVDDWGYEPLIPPLKIQTINAVDTPDNDDWSESGLVYNEPESIIEEYSAIIHKWWQRIKQSCEKKKAKHNFLF